ncbi:TPA: PEGA domain-containing protein [Candidatus Berkelbacteria bacterium]|uniref:PEGA domain-containing protein n=1 Tax=Berkelbacteria bacterium GW2011_GWE1_39_12 TaxID=1618337 RepID=A0A0G4B5E1_9BACT|nr:MAG: hypothetical protein UT28_C0001G0996 [Berkelbacteria bacterium GW2011_GWE1_39_12]HBO60144.1 PEGA domain-containing protein [Candidatus Berkelbacteria bacterium]
MKKVGRKQFYFGIFWIVLVASFIFFASLLVLVANGYHLNYKNFKVEKTGMIVIYGSTEPVKVTINGKEKTVTLPAKFPQLFPGSYSVKIEKEGFFSYQKSFQLNGGQAVMVNDINLIKQNIKPKEIVSDIKTINKIKSDNIVDTTQFAIIKNELWQNDKLITRFSQEIISAVYDSSASQFLVQLSDGIHVIFPDGSNDNLIIKFDSIEPIIMSINSNTLSYILKDKVYQAQIR